VIPSGASCPPYISRTGPIEHMRSSLLAVIKYQSLIARRNTYSANAKPDVATLQMLNGRCTSSGSCP
jgi:hypothetical protein